MKEGTVQLMKDNNIDEMIDDFREASKKTTTKRMLVDPPPIIWKILS